MKLSHFVDSDAHAMEEPQERKSNEAKGISGKQRIHLMRKIKQPRQQRRENGLKSHLINVTKCFVNIFSIISSHYAFEMFPSSSSIGMSGVGFWKKCCEYLWSNAYAVHKRMAAKSTILKNGHAMRAKWLFVFVKFVTFFFHRCPSCISSQMLSEHPQNPSPSLPANWRRLTCHDFHSETLKKQELQPLTLTCPGTSELIEN